MRSIGKLLMNALYGKMLEKARFNKTQLCNNIKEVYKFMTEHKLTDITFMGSKVLLSGEPHNDTMCNDSIKKPAHLGSFVLAYSRRIMLNVMDDICPELDTQFFSYTDTDSLHVHCDKLEGLKAKGWLEKGLGKLSDDCKGGKIIREINLAPKMYAYICLMPDGKLKTVCKAKGIPSQYLSGAMYEAQKPVEVEMKGRLKKIGYGKCVAKDLRDKAPFSIVGIDMTRTWYKNEWDGMTLNNGKWFPHGYEA